MPATVAAIGVADDPYLTRAHWQDAKILPPPETGAGACPPARCPRSHGNSTLRDGRYLALRLRHRELGGLFTASNAGKHELCCRTIDANGVAQPLPRPLPKSGRNEIQRIRLTVEA